MGYTGDAAGTEDFGWQPDGTWDADGRPSTLELLAQRKWWYPADGRRLKVKQMTPGHRKNLLAWFERRAYYLQLLAIMNGLAERDVSTGGRRWHPDAELHARLRERSSELNWLNDCPLIVRLRKLVERDNARTAEAASIAPAPVVHRAYVGDDREKVWAWHSDHRLSAEAYVPHGTAVHAVQLPGRISLYGPNGMVLASQAAALF